MSTPTRRCPDCDESPSEGLSRRSFLVSAGALAAAAAGASPLSVLADTAPAADAKGIAPETTVKRLFQSLAPNQRKDICFDWNYQDPKRGLLRTFVANNWKITQPEINSK